MKHCILVNKALKLLLCQINLEKPTETFKMVTVHLTVHYCVPGQASLGIIALSSSSSFLILFVNKRN